MPNSKLLNIFSFLKKHIYFILILVVYLFTFIVLRFENASSNIYYTIILFIIAVTSLSYMIFRKMITENTHKLVRLTERLKYSDYIMSLENYDERLNEVKEIFNELLMMGNSFQLTNESSSIYNNFINIFRRLIDEINAAKVFKINRNEFLGNVSHELRTPLFALQMSLEALHDDVIEDESIRKDFLSKALNQTKRLTELVDDLISISKLEAGMKLSKRYFSIDNLITEVTGELKTIAKKYNTEIYFYSETNSDDKVFGDMLKIKQVLVNLIDNAIKYSDDEGTVIIKTEKNSNSGITISISDNGSGIASIDLPRIFERFYRVDKNRSRNTGGSGLGLSIVKHILDLHQSSIKVKSEIGKGSVFSFTLPY